MKSLLTSLTLGALVIQSHALGANVLVNSFNSAQTWDSFGSLTVTVSGGVATVSGPESESSYAEYFLAPIDIGTNNAITISAILTGGNTSTNNVFTVSFLNELSFKVASASFATSSFNNLTFTTAQSTLTFESGFDPSNVDLLRIGGFTTGGTQTLGIQIDHITATTAVPEPSTFAAILGIGAVGIYGTRRRKRVIKA